jgi:uncharacterized protein (DUF342 family)
MENSEKQMLQERLDAKKAMEKAQEKLERAEEAFTRWKETNGILPDNPVYQELKQEVERNFTSVESCRRTYGRKCLSQNHTMLKVRKDFVWTLA